MSCFCGGIETQINFSLDGHILACPLCPGYSVHYPGMGRVLPSQDCLSLVISGCAQNLCSLFQGLAGVLGKPPTHGCECFSRSPPLPLSLTLSVPLSRPLPPLPPTLFPSFSTSLAPLPLSLSHTSPSTLSSHSLTPLFSLPLPLTTLLRSPSLPLPPSPTSASPAMYRHRVLSLAKARGETRYAGGEQQRFIALFSGR